MSACAAVRIRVTRDLLDDDDFWFSDKLRRHVVGQLWSVPAGVRVFLDLGPLKRLDPCFVRDLAERPCASMIVFEHADWRLAQEYASALNSAALAVRVAT